MGTLNFLISECQASKMSIEDDKKKIEHALKTYISPDHYFASEMRKNYRELEEKKQKSD